MTKQSATLTFYNDNAADVAARQLTPGKHQHAEQFAKLLPDAAHLLDLGAGAGRDSRFFQSKGFQVTALDASEGLAKQAADHLGLAIRVGRYEELNDKEAFDAIWASASLLHATRESLPDIFRRVHAALVPGGLFYASFKVRNEDWIDKFGRFFCAMDKQRLESLLSDTRFEIIELDESQGSRIEGRLQYGSDGELTDWVWAIARKRGTS